MVAQASGHERVKLLGSIFLHGPENVARTGNEMCPSDADRAAVASETLTPRVS